MQSEQYQLHAKIEDRHWWFVARRQIVRELLQRYLPPSPQRAIVDVGCGTGANLASFAQDYDCLGIDPSPDAVAFAQQRFPHAQFICGLAPRDLGTWSATADAFLLMDVLEHVPDDFAMFSELLAAAKPGALFVVTVPADASLWSPHDEAFGHYRRYDAQRLERVWQGLPVESLLLSHYSSRLYPVVRCVRTAGRLWGRGSGEAGTDFRILPGPLNRGLTKLFAGESRRLHRVAAGHAPPYSRGVSLIALLRRLPGRVPWQSRPADIAPDLFDPAAQVPSLAAV